MESNFGMKFLQKKRYTRTRKTYYILAIAVTRKPAALQNKQIQRFSSLLYLFIGTTAWLIYKCFLGFETDINSRPYMVM